MTRWMDSTYEYIISATHRKIILKYNSHNTNNIVLVKITSYEKLHWSVPPLSFYQVISIEIEIPARPLQ
jgi:hypothetical protein